MLRTLLFSALLVAFAAQVMAQDDGVKVGDDIVNLNPRNWINPPLIQNFDELKGDVIMVKSWGIN